MARKVDPAELVNPEESAVILGVATNSVSVYRKRYSDFPTPVVDKGRCVLWLKADIEAWAARRRV